MLDAIGTMPERVIVAYAMIAVLLLIGVAIAMRLTRGRRNWHSAVRRYRRARRDAERADAKLAGLPPRQ